MSKIVQPAEIRDFVAQHLADVFDTMLSQKAALTPDAEPPVFADRISGSVGFAGEAVTGSIYLHLHLTFATAAAVNMLALPPEEPPGDAEVNDVIGELTNMLGGGLKSWLCDVGAKCALTTPAVIRGKSFSIVPNASVQVLRLPFETETTRGLVEVHTKFN
jgi:chemotaxis protein CheX